MSRFECKYLIPDTLESVIKAQISSRMHFDPYGTAGPGTYHVNSLYFDSPELGMYQEKLDGMLWRNKVRVRHYSRIGPPYNLEIKERVNNQVVKKKFRLKPHHFEAVNRGQFIHDGQENPAVSLYNRQVRRLHSRPVAYISYTRSAYVSNLPGNLRITFDKNLMVIRSNRLGDFRGHHFPILGPNFIVLEIKFNGLMPEWVHDLVVRHNLWSQSVSKYCLGVQRLLGRQIIPTLEAI